MLQAGRRSAPPPRTGGPRGIGLVALEQDLDGQVAAEVGVAPMRTAPMPPRAISPKMWYRPPRSAGAGRSSAYGRVFAPSVSSVAVSGRSTRLTLPRLKPWDSQSTITAICRWSYAISLSVRPSEDDPVPVCPAVRIWRVRLTTIPTAIRSMASLVIARPSSFVPSWFYAGKGFLPTTRNHKFSKNGPRRDVFKHTITARSHQDRTPSSHP